MNNESVTIFIYYFSFPKIINPTYFYSLNFSSNTKAIGLNASL